MTVRRLLAAGAAAVTGVYLVVLVVWPDALFAFTFDDGFYYLGIARNLAAGEGSTWDGIEPTNGYHPLWMALLVPVYAVGLDGMTAVRVVLVGQLLLYGAALLVVARALARLIGDRPRLADRPPKARRWCDLATGAAFVLVAGNPFVVRTFVNGLESGLVVLFGAGILACALTGDGAWLTPDRRRWPMALLLVGAFLARTDAAVTVAAFGLWCLPEAVRLGRRAVRPLLTLFGPVALTALAFLAGNQMAFGHPMQVSGVVKRAELTSSALLGLGLTAVLAGAFGYLGWRRRGRPTGRFPTVDAVLARTAWYGAAAVALIGYYQFLQVQQWLWYYAPVVLYLLVLLVAAVADFTEAALLEAGPERSPGRVLAPVLVLLLGPLAVAAVLQVSDVADPDLRSIQLANRDAGVWIDQQLPEDAVLASWDAGVVGYFAERPTVNLDGVVNSFAFDEAVRAGELFGFLDERGVGYVVNHGEDVAGRDPEIDAFIDDWRGEGAGAEATVLADFGFRFSGVKVGRGFDGAAGDRPQAVFVYAVPDA